MKLIEFDGRIELFNADIELRVPLTWFKSITPEYESVYRREYDGLVHRVWREPGNQGTGPVPWERGDAIIERTEFYRELYDAYLKEQAQGSSPSTVEEARMYVHDLITELRNEKEFSEFSWQGRSFQADRDSVTRIAATFAIALAGQLPEPFAWQDVENQMWECSTAEFIEFAQALWARNARLFAMTRFHKAAIEQLTTVEDVLSYNYFSNWE